MAGFMELQVWEEDGKWYAQYSAPGYLDCTDPEGPYDTEEEAAIECFSIHGEDGEGEGLTPDEQELIDIIGLEAFENRFN